MAFFQFKDKTLAYTSRPSPTAFDLLLLADLDVAAEIWDDTLAELSDLNAGGGRVIVAQASGDAEHVLRFLQTLDVLRLHVVAYGSSAAIVKDIQARDAKVIAQALFVAKGDGKEIKRATLSFCGL